ncbi:MAG: hypothetical protein ABI769_10515 [Pseudomonadota bacterium]
MGIYTVEDDPRGVGGGRALAHRITTPAPPPPPQEYPPFSVETMGFAGNNSIPDALAYALKWQVEFLSLPDPPGERKQELADNLIRIWQYLVAQEVTSPRDADGTLLMNDLMKAFGHVKGKVTSIEVAYNESVPSAELESEPLDPWAPKLFPRELPAVQRQLYPARPRKLDDIPPFFPDMVKGWVVARAYQTPPANAVPAGAPPKKSPYAMNVLNDVQAPGPTDEKQVQAAIDQAELALNRADIANATIVATSGPTPTINKAIGTLKKVTMNDIERQTQVQLHDAWSDQPLYSNTELILYHSVFSFVLDKNGEPYTINGRLDYPILVPEPGSQMKRHCPPPGGVFVSVQKYGFQNYRIEQGRIDKVLDGGVGGFEEYGYGYSGPHAFHQMIQGYLDSLGSHVFIAGVTMPAAVKREEITLSRISWRVPEFAEACVPPLVKEVTRRAKDKIEHWEDFVKEIAVEVIKGIIVDEVKRRARNYIIKKIGVRIVPGLNAAAAIYDLATGGTERMRMRNAIACILVALESDSAEDMTVAAKVCARIVADAFEDKIMAAIINAGKKAAMKAGKHVAMKVRGSADTPPAETEKPSAPADPAQSKAPQTQTQAPTPATTGSPGKPPVVAPSTKGAQPDNLSLGAGGPVDQKPAANKPAPKSMDAADQAVADMRKQIHDDLRAKAEEAVRQGSAPPDTPPATEAAVRKKAGKAAAAGTTDDGTKAAAASDTGVTPDARGTGAKISASAAGSASPPSSAAAAVGGSGGSSGSGGGGGTGDGSSGGGGRRRRGQPPPRPPRGPPPADAGTLENPRRIKAQPDPVLPDVGVKDDRSALDDDSFQDVRTQLNPPTAARSDVEMLRANRDAIGEPIQQGDDPHHTLHKKAGGETGESAREAARNSGVSVNTPEAGLAARGTSPASQATDDRGVRPVQDTVADHTKQHGEKQLGPLEKRLGTVDGDDDATRGILRDTTNIRADGRKDEDPEFWLNSRSGRDTGDDKPSPSGIIPPETKKRRSDSAKKGAETRRRNAQEKARKKKEDEDKDGGDDDDKK